MQFKTFINLMKEPYKQLFLEYYSTSCEKEVQLLTSKGV